MQSKTGDVKCATNLLSNAVGSGVVARALRLLAHGEAAHEVVHGNLRAARAGAWDIRSDVSVCARAPIDSGPDAGSIIRIDTLGPKKKEKYAATVSGSTATVTNTGNTGEKSK